MAAINSPSPSCGRLPRGLPLKVSARKSCWRPWWHNPYPAASECAQPQWRLCQCCAAPSKRSGPALTVLQLAVSCPDSEDALIRFVVSQTTCGRTGLDSNSCMLCRCHGAGHTASAVLYKYVYRLASQLMPLQVSWQATYKRKMKLLCNACLQQSVMIRQTADLFQHEMGWHESLAFLQVWQAVFASPLGVWIHIQPVALRHHQTYDTTEIVCSSVSSASACKVGIVHSIHKLQQVESSLLQTLSLAQQESAYFSINCMPRTRSLSVVLPNKYRHIPTALKPSPATCTSSLVSKPTAALEQVARKERTMNS